MDSEIVAAEVWWDLSQWEIAEDQEGDHLYVKRGEYEIRAYLPRCDAGHHSVWWSIRGPQVELHGRPRENSLSRARLEVVSRYRTLVHARGEPE